jgi:hypothetical protein
VEALNELTITTQKLLKEEWEKVKDEVERGNLKKEKKSRVWLWQKKHRRL